MALEGKNRFPVQEYISDSTLHSTVAVVMEHPELPLQVQVALQLATEVHKGE